MDSNQTEIATGRGHPHLRPNPDVIAQRMRDDVVLVHLRTDRIYELNRTGARLWELISAGYDLVQIQAQMLQEFDVDAAQLLEEIKEILALMQKKDLVRVDERG